jgi:hypothetical protein
MGSVSYALTFTNTGSASCTLVGFPGVSLLDGSGDQIGSPATREGDEGAPVRLAPGGSAHSGLRTQNGATCQSASTVKVYAPGSTQYSTVKADGFSVCGGVFGVSTLTSGTGL